MIGGGSLPGATLPTRLLAVAPPKGRRRAAAVLALSASLRRREMPVVGRVDDDTLLLDPRSVLPEDDETVRQALRDMAGAFPGTR